MNPFLVCISGVFIFLFSAGGSEQMMQWYQFRSRGFCYFYFILLLFLSMKTPKFHFKKTVNEATIKKRNNKTVKAFDSKEIPVSITSNEQMVVLFSSWPAK